MSVPFSRPGAVDLSALKSTAPPAGGARPGTAGGSPTTGGSGAYSVDLDESNFQDEMQRSMQVPIVLSFWSRQAPVSLQLNESLEGLADEFGGRFLLAKVDVDANPQIAQAVGIPGAPLVAVALGGRLAPLTQDNIAIDELRQVLEQVVQSAAANGVTGRVEPRGGPAQPEAEEPESDPRYAEAEEALTAGDLEGAVAAYQRLLKENPGDDVARTGLAQVELVSRTRDVDLDAARHAAAADPGDVDAQINVADVDLMGGHVEDAFDRLVSTIARVSGEDRDKARTHLVELFEIVGNDDPRVRTFRTRLANALF
jgi:putative thioredoxin